MPDFTSVQELVEYHRFPFQLRQDQIEDVEAVVDFRRAALFNEVGTGKTATATAICLAWEEDYNILLVPPILQRQWARWLESLHGAGAVVVYQGERVKRRALNLLGFKWVIMTLPIFKNDYHHLEKMFQGRSLVGLVDEGHAVKNTASKNHKCYRDFFGAHRMLILTGTPVSFPTDAYAYIKLKTPNVYRSMAHFENVHVASRDFFGNVTEWQMLDKMGDNLMLQATRRFSRDVLTDLSKPNYIPLEYDLDSQHLDLYNVLADEQLLLLPDGGKIDATSAGRLYNALQQIVCNWSHFSGVSTDRPAAFDLIDEIADQIDLLNPERSKLIIYTYYVMTSASVTAYLREKFGAVACYSSVSAKQQADNIDRFLSDPACRVMVAQPGSGGMGWNPQHVCWEMLFLEEPVIPLHFIQGVGRIVRDGQTRVPNIRLAIANGTIQRRLHDNLLIKDATANKVQGGYEDLRDAIHGL